MLKLKVHLKLKQVKERIVNKKKPFAGNDEKQSLPAVPKPAYDWISFKFINMENLIPILKEKYPAVNIESEIRSAEGWLMGHSKNRKSNYVAFLNNWMKRTQDRAPAQDSSAGKPVMSLKDAMEKFKSDGGKLDS